MTERRFYTCDACDRSFSSRNGLLPVGKSYHACSEKCAADIGRMTWVDALNEGDLSPELQRERTVPA